MDHVMWPVSVTQLGIYYSILERGCYMCQLLFTGMVPQCNLMDLAYLHDIKEVRELKNCNSNLTIQPSEAWFTYTYGTLAGYCR